MLPRESQATRLNRLIAASLSAGGWGSGVWGAGQEQGAAGAWPGAGGGQCSGTEPGAGLARAWQVTEGAFSCGLLIAPDLHLNSHFRALSLAELVLSLNLVHWALLYDPLSCEGGGF